MQNVNKNLSQEDSKKYEGLTTEKECLKALNTMKTNKSPGLDRLTGEVYRTFWDVLSDPLTNSYNETFLEAPCQTGGIQLL